MATTSQPPESTFEPLAKLPFPPVTRRHILNCSYPEWYKKYRPLTPKARLIPLPPAFVAYLKADGIYLPPDPADANRRSGEWSDEDSGIFSSAEAENAADESDDENAGDPSTHWPEVHARVQEVIKELGGRVAPRLNWSAPKDATWIVPGNSMICSTANDVYLLLKSSDFVTHDLENVFDDTDEPVGHGDGDGDGDQGGGEDADGEEMKEEELKLEDVQYTLILRKSILINPSLEFRCFVRRRHLLCITQRDLNHYAFLTSLSPLLRQRIQDFFDAKLKTTFPDADFVFDVYVPPPHERVWLIDINPFAPRTDSLLYSWREVLEMEVLEDTADEANHGAELAAGGEEPFVRIYFNRSSSHPPHATATTSAPSNSTSATSSGDDEDAEEEDLELERLPPLRLVNKGDPEAYSFNSPQYSAHKLPRDVVDAAAAGASGDAAGLREFAERWRELKEGRGEESSDEE